MGKRTLYLKTVWSPYLGEWRPFHDNWISKENTACIFNGTAIYTIPPSPTPSPTNTLTPTITPSQTPTLTPTNTPTNTSSVTPTITPSQTPTLTPSVTPTISLTPTITPTQTNTPSPTSPPSPSSFQLYFSGNGSLYTGYTGYYNWSSGNTANGSKYIISSGSPTTATTVCGDYAGSGFTFWVNSSTGHRIVLRDGNWFIDPTGYPASACGSVTTLGGSLIPLQGFNDGYTDWYGLKAPMQFYGAQWKIFYGIPPSPTPTPSVTPTLTPTNTPTPGLSPTPTTSVTPTITPSPTSAVPSFANLWDWWVSDTGVATNPSNQVTGWTGVNGIVLSAHTNTRLADYISSDIDFNNYPSIKLNPTGSTLDWGYKTPQDASSSSECVIMVGYLDQKITTTLNNLLYVGSFTTPRMALYGQNASNEYRWIYRASGATSDTGGNTGTTYVNGTYQLIRMQYDRSTGVYTYFASTGNSVSNTIAVSTGTSGQSMNSGFFVVGGNQNNFGPTPVFRVVEIVYINGIPSAAEILTYETYLNYKYNL